MIRPSRSITGPYTVDDFFAIVQDGEKGDLIDGVIYMASPESPRTNKIAGFIYRLIWGYITERGISAECYFSRVAFVLDDSHAPEPDVAYLCPERAHLEASGRVKGAPDVAVEIVSHDSIDRDYELKRAMYEAAGVPEYWLIDPLENRCDFLMLRDGKYQHAELENGTQFHSRVIPGFWLDTEWLFANPLPKETDCLRRMLS